MIDDLLLLSGNDLPFFEARLTVHQPRLKEIAYITEQKFWLACQLLRFDKEKLLSQDKNDLLNQSNFNIIMTLMQEKTAESYQTQNNVLSLLALMFPTSEIALNRDNILIKNPQTNEIGMIDDNNFEKFKQIFIDIFCLSDMDDKQYNPNGDLAKKIAEKLRKGKQQKAKLAPQQKIAILGRYVSILAVGQQKDMNDLMNYTVYQIMDEFNRYKLKLHYDAWQRYKIAGAEGLEDPEDWLKDIHV